MAVDKEKYTPIPCIKIACTSCLFYDDGCRIGKLKEWAEKEYKYTTVISRADISFLTHIKDEFKYMARDENGDLYAHVINPKKYKQYGIWIGGDSINFLNLMLIFQWLNIQMNRAGKYLI